MTQKVLEYDLLILGGGAAGLTAGIYGGRSLLKTAVIDTGVTGGQLTNILEIENYPGFPIIGGYDLVEKMEEHADKFGIEKFVMQEIVKVDLTSPIKTIETTDTIFKGKTVIIATGARLKKLGVSGEDEFVGRGVSYCAVCDGAFFRDKEVCVVGGGNAAVEEAVYLTRFASRVNIIHRRDSLRAEKVYQERANANPKINYIWDTVVTSINGENKVESVNLQNVKTGETTELKTDAVFPYIGYDPNTELFRGQIKLDAQGFVEINTDLSTSCEGVFAAGDVRVSPLRQVVVSAADGAISATGAAKYIEEKHVVSV
jgi:thioredoxin reductase (NADPH)